MVLIANYAITDSIFASESNNSTLKLHVIELLHMSKGSELLYARPILIYDNFCYSCTKFAQISRILSRDRIYLVGHYTDEGQEIKACVFPDGFDSNTMFWMVTARGAFGARSGLLPLVSEIIKGLFGIGIRVSMMKSVRFEKQSDPLCNFDSMSCSSVPSFFSRLSGLLKNSKKIERAG